LKKQPLDSLFNRILFAGFILTIIYVACYLLLSITVSPFVSKFDGIIKAKLSDPGFSFIFLPIFLALTVFIIISTNKSLLRYSVENQHRQEEPLMLLLLNFFSAYLVFSGIFGIDPFVSPLKDNSYGYVLRVQYSILAGLTSVLFIKIRNSNDLMKVTIKYMGYLLFTLLLYGMLLVGVQGKVSNSGHMKIEWDGGFWVLSLYPFVGLGSLAIVEKIIQNIQDTK